VEIETVGLGVDSCGLTETGRGLAVEAQDRCEKVEHTGPGGRSRSEGEGISGTDMVHSGLNAAAWSAGCRVIGKWAVAFVPAASALVDAFAVALVGVSAR